MIIERMFDRFVALEREEYVGSVTLSDLNRYQLYTRLEQHPQKQNRKETE